MDEPCVHEMAPGTCSLCKTPSEFRSRPPRAAESGSNARVANVMRRALSAGARPTWNEAVALLVAEYGWESGLAHQRLWGGTERMEADGELVIDYRAFDAGTGPHVFRLPGEVPEIANPDKAELAALMLRDIRDGTWPKHAKFRRAQLASRYGVTQASVAFAMQELKKASVVECAGRQWWYPV